MTLVKINGREIRDPDRYDSEALSAREILQSCGVPVGADYHTLDSSQVDAIVAAAARAKYRKPRNANGSRGRYYHDRLQRQAQRLTLADVRRSLTP